MKVYLKKTVTVFIVVTLIVLSLFLIPQQVLADVQLIDEVFILGVKEPRVGMSPDKDLIILPDNANYEFSRGPDWTTDTGFEFGKKYDLSFWLVAKEGYEFNPEKVTYVLKGLDESLYTYGVGILGDSKIERRLYFEFKNPVSEYDVSKNWNIEWDAETGDDVEIVSAGDFALFTGIKINGEAVDTKNYEASSGSTHIKLYQEYLKTLNAGLHKLVIEYSDGKTSSADINILSGLTSDDETSDTSINSDESVQGDKADSVGTEDVSKEDTSEVEESKKSLSYGPIVIIALLVILFIVVAIVFIIKRKK